MRRLRIGVNALYLIPGSVGGTEIYLRSLLAPLASLDTVNEYFVFVNSESDRSLVPAAPNFHLLRQPVAGRIRPARLLWEQLGLPCSALRHRLDVMFNPGITAPLASPVPSVTVFHDLQHKRYPQHFRWFDLPVWRLMLWASAHRSRHLLTPSEATRQDLLRYYSLPEERISTVPHGVDERFFTLGRERHPASIQPLLLCVSTLHPHKNIERLVRVFARFRAAHPDYHLVLAGLRGFHAAPVERLVESLRLSDVVRITGWIPREELYELYRAARGFLYPSTFEGFGMPVLESLAAAIPTACSAIEPLLTIAGGAALTFPPEDDDAMLEAMEKLLRQPPVDAAGPARAGRYSWLRAAEQTLEALYRSTSSS
ncbi:MAG: glycosyltransferase family 1 protein [Acidobacteria bacterium]|nr:glycosyltransferase family 1 protein [Acidobacteriota bacterium]